MDNELLQKAMEIALTYDVQTAKDSVVVFSVSFQPSKENKIKAKEYVAQNSSYTILDYTPCGEALLKLNLEDYAQDDDDMEKIAEVWRVASKRFMESASGNITAFVEGADERSVFRMAEFPEIIRNPDILTINGIDKEVFKSQMGW